jgi:hypothetical protein
LASRHQKGRGLLARNPNHSSVGSIIVVGARSARRGSIVKLPCGGVASHPDGLTSDHILGAAVNRNTLVPHELLLVGPDLLVVNMKLIVLLVSVHLHTKELLHHGFPMVVSPIPWIRSRRRREHLGGINGAKLVLDPFIGVGQGFSNAAFYNPLNIWSQNTAPPIKHTTANLIEDIVQEVKALVTLKVIESIDQPSTSHALVTTLESNSVLENLGVELIPWGHG